MPDIRRPSSTNNFCGIEGRIFLNGAVVGGNIGRFDVASGPGTLTDAWFV